MSDRTLPHNLDAERSVLGAILIDNHAINLAIENVRQFQPIGLAVYENTGNRAAHRSEAENGDLMGTHSHRSLRRSALGYLLIAHLLTIGSEPVQPPSGRLDKKGFVAILSSITQYFVPELAAQQDGEESPEALIRRLLDRGDSLFWSPFLLKHAIDCK